MFFLARLSIANKSVVAFAAVTLVLIGVYLTPTLKQELLPPIFQPQITVTAAYPGASPKQVEQDVTNPLEQAFQSLPGVTLTTSQSSEGFSAISVSYDFSTDLDKAQQKLQEQVNQVQSSLPANVTPQLSAVNTDTFPIIVLSVSSSQDQQDLAVALNKIVVPDLQSISGVGIVNVTGVRQQMVSVTLDLNKLLASKITMDQVQGALQANNITMPAGDVDSNGRILAIRVGNTFHSIQNLKNLVVGISLPAGQNSASPTGQDSALQSASRRVPSAMLPVTDPMPIKLGDIATVQEDLTPLSTLSRVNGKSGLSITLTKAQEGNAVSISQTLRKHIPDLEDKLGHHAQITIVSDGAPLIQSAIADLVREGLLGAFFAIVVILIFLFSFRSTLVTSISIPLSLLIALIGLWMQHYSLNELTLSGLTVAIGRVVDDSIVVLENIYRHLQKGVPKREATLNGVKEVAAAVTSSTLTTVAVFLPLAFMGGLSGEYAHPLAMTVTIALLASLVVALTIIPVLAYWFLKGPAESLPQLSLIEKPSILERGYTPLITWVTTYPARTVILAIILLIGSFLLFPLLPSNAFGDQGSSSFFFTITLPENTTLDHVDQAARKVEGILAGISDIQAYQTTVGSSHAISKTNVAQFMVNVKPDIDTSKVEKTVRDRLKNLSDIGTTSFSNQGANVVDITVQAPDDQSLQQATQQVIDMLKHVPSTVNVKSDLSDVVPLIDVQVDPAKAALHGLTSAQIAQLLRFVYSGTTATHVVLEGANNALQNVDLKLAISANTAQDMQNMQLLSPTGSVRLGDVADISQVNGPTQISHLNGIRTTTITFSVTSQNVQGVAEIVLQRITTLHLPAGAKASLGTTSSGDQDAINQFYLILLFAIPMVFIVMVATFHSVIQPLILLISIPFAAVGSIVLSVMTQTAIGISSLFGALMLIGIVVTNAIVLIDRINHFRAEGMDVRTAVIAGGSQRVRPILMTALATIMALIPMAVGTGGGGALIISGGLAIVVIGGLTSSTFLTLLLVPTLYVIVENTRERWKKQRQVFGRTREAAEQIHHPVQVRSPQAVKYSLQPENTTQLYKGVDSGCYDTDSMKGNTVHHFEHLTEQIPGMNNDETNAFRGDYLSETSLEIFNQIKGKNTVKQQKQYQRNNQAHTPDLQKPMRSDGNIPLSRKTVGEERKQSGETHGENSRRAETTVQIKIVAGNGRTLKMDFGKGKPKVEGPQEIRKNDTGSYIYTYPVKVHSTERGMEVSCCGNEVNIIEDHIKIATSEIDSIIYITKKNIRLKIETSSKIINVFSSEKGRPESPIEYTKIANEHNDTYSLGFRRFDDKNSSKGSFSSLGEMIIERGKNVQRKITGKDGTAIEVITYHDGNDIQIYRNGKVIILEDYNNNRVIKVRKKDTINVQVKHHSV